MTFVDKKEKAENLRKEKNFDEAVSVYRDLWENYRDLCDEWIGWGYAFSLRKVDRSVEALDICRDTYRMNKEFEYNNSLYGWCIYDTEIKNKKPQLQELLKAANAIVQLTQQGQYSPYEYVVFQIIDALRKQAMVSWKSVLEWIDRLDPSRLSTEENRYTTDDRKQIVSASPLEKYYAHKTKALEQLNLHEECLKTSNEALLKLSKFHHDNDIWFARRASLAKGSLGKLDEAIRDLQQLTARKPDWFLYHEIAQFQYDLGQVKNALVSAATAALAPGPLTFKSELFKLISVIMEDMNVTILAQEHLKLVHLIRAQEGWKHDPELEANLERLDVDVNEDENTKAIVRNLRPVWEEAKYTNKQYITGTVETIFDHGGAGFIVDKTGQSHYFDMRDAQTSELESGTRVSFYVIDSFDKVKNRKSTKAIHITIDE
jgi:tetratricopeptide (TPR) repeat protein/cold shock CspA family protein